MIFGDKDGYSIIIKTGQSCGVSRALQGKPFKADLIALQNIAIGKQVSKKPNILKPRESAIRYDLNYKSRGRQVIYTIWEQTFKNGKNSVSYNVTKGF